MKPFLKWVGGKTQIIDKIIPIFPKKIHNYYEPFLGGGSVLLAALNEISKGNILLIGKIYASDANLYLIETYQSIQKYPIEFMSELDSIISQFLECPVNGEINRSPSNIKEAMTSKESYYYWIRSKFNEMRENREFSIVRAAMFLFMNKTGFRGIYREGPNGYNVPYGNNKNPTIYTTDHILEISRLISNVEFIHCDFMEALPKACQEALPKACQEALDDFVYLDPPYAPETDTSFVKYTVGGFDKTQHQLLFDACKKIPRFLMSNSAVDMVLNEFPVEKYRVTKIECRRAIHSKNPETKTNEVLISSYF